MEKKSIKVINIILIIAFLLIACSAVFYPTVNASDGEIELTYKSETTDYFSKKSVSNILKNFNYLKSKKGSIFKPFKFDAIKYAKDLYEYLGYAKDQISAMNTEDLLYITKVNAATVQTYNLEIDEYEGITPVAQSELPGLLNADASVNLGTSYDNVVGDKGTKDVMTARIEVYQDPQYDYYMESTENYTKDSGKPGVRSIRSEFYEYGFNCILSFSWVARDTANPVWSLTDQMYLHFSRDVKTEFRTKKYKKDYAPDWHNDDANKWTMTGSYTYFNGTETVTVNSPPAFYVSSADSAVTRPYLNQDIKRSSDNHGQTLKLQTVLRKQYINAYPGGSNDFHVYGVYVHHRIAIDNNIVLNLGVDATGPSVSATISANDKAEMYTAGHATIDCQPVPEMEAIRSTNY